MATKSYYKQISEDAKVARQAMTRVSAGKGKDSGHEVAQRSPLAAPSLQAAMSAVGTDMMLQKGIPVLKLSSRGVWNHRILTLSSDKLAFFITHEQLPSNLRSYVASSLPIPLWTPSRGFSWSASGNPYTRHLDIADIDVWQVGVLGTQILEYASESLHGKVDGVVTIFHNSFRQSLNLAIHNESHRQALVQALAKMKKTYNAVVPFVANEQLLLRYVYYDIDVDSNGQVSSKEFGEICKRINLELKDRDKVFADFLKAARTKNGKKGLGGSKNELTSSEVEELLYSISAKTSPAHALWDHLFGPSASSIGVAKFRDDFLLACQGEMQTSLVDAELLVESLKIFTNTSKVSKTISKAEFVDFLQSGFNSAYDPSATTPLSPNIRLNKPLSHYWINTSHNTYLTGDQLQSRSSVEAYLKALYRGCKCLELDCWDGDDGKKSNIFTPVVFHGHTLTSKIKFRAICLAVRNYLTAHPNSYPIILSLENHCSHPYQRTMASDLKEIFGKKLFVPSGKQTSGGSLLSPEELRGMIVIKGKRPPEPEEESVSKNGKSTVEKGAVRGSSNVDDVVDEYDEATKKGKSKIVPELARLTLFHGTKYADFNNSIKLNPSHMHSIGESKIKKILAKSSDAADLWRKYNVQHMTRTYPSGARVDSSNYNPVLAWAVGCQLVALNFQTSDAPLVLNDGMFLQAGGCGYVEKPASVLSGASPSKKKLRIEILSAQCLPKPDGGKTGETIDPYIQVELHDVGILESGKEEYISTSFKTSCVDNNGFCPVWKDAATDFDVCNPDVAMVLIKIVDEDWDLDDMIASSAIPVSQLRKGYRSIPLYTQTGTRSGAYQSATLLVKIVL